MNAQAAAEKLAQNSVLTLVSRGLMALSLPVMGFVALTTWNILADHSTRLTKLEQRMEDGAARRDQQIADINAQYLGVVQALSKQADAANAKFDVIISKMNDISNDVAGLNATVRQNSNHQ